MARAGSVIDSPFQPAAKTREAAVVRRGFNSMVFSQFRSTSFIRVCQPFPVSLNYFRIFISSWSVICTFFPLPAGCLCPGLNCCNSATVSGALPWSARAAVVICVSSLSIGLIH